MSLELLILALTLSYRSYHEAPVSAQFIHRSIRAIEIYTKKSEDIIKKRFYRCKAHFMKLAGEHELE